MALNIMIIDGRKIANDIKDELKKELVLMPKIMLGIVLVGNNPVSLKYVNKKKILGEEIGVGVRVFDFPENISEDGLVLGVNKAVLESDGVIIQLPLPSQIDVQKILNLVPREKDVDCLSDSSKLEGKIFSPVVEAVKEILKVTNVDDIKNKKVTIIGKGRLVGKPVLEWLKKEGVIADIFGRDNEDLKNISIKNADILILSAGSPGIIKPEMIKDGVVLIDASTSEVSGVLMGDALESCASKCSIFTPVPGGVGPLTVVMLFRNLVGLCKYRQ
ncbi:MAG: bifunctional 5,10-methylenetetrahydrofolate dehydrogenase/5,10-methenyltetrahydrofolate cyclohydrolase [bacterium]